MNVFNSRIGQIPNSTSPMIVIYTTLGGKREYIRGLGIRGQPLPRMYLVFAFNHTLLLKICQFIHNLDSYLSETILLGGDYSVIAWLGTPSELTESKRPVSVCSSVPVAVSQSLIVLSYEPEARMWPSCEKATDQTQSEWPSNICRRLHVFYQLVGFALALNIWL